MNEFKGTKGEWKADYGGEITSNNRFICDCAILTEEDRYNAQLISCAPEMLEMLKTVSKELWKDGISGSTSLVDRIDSLITKATTI